MQAGSSLRPILLLEINEVPWKVVDRFVEDPRLPHLTAFFRSSRTYTTRSADVGELSPWITWPSLHRGMNNTGHGIKNLGQDPATFRGKPIWEEYRERGHSIGICGSMQSWPPADPGRDGFYIPDTFAHDERCIPSYIEPFQRFNLGLVGKNGLVVKRDGLINAATVKLIASLPKLGLRPITLLRILQQLLLERTDASALARRPIFQAVLAWDIFRRLYRTERSPTFATFFTNHVAGVMHRYWRDTFPEDFGESVVGRTRSHAPTMFFALRVLDQILADAIKLGTRNRDLLVAFATSMGQAAIQREHEGYAAAISDLPRLMSVLGFSPSSYTPLLAMVPQVALEVSDQYLRKCIEERLVSCTTASGARLFTVETVGRSVSISIRTPRVHDIRGGGLKRGSDGNDRLIPWVNAGISMHEVEAGTAYHVPEGILALRGAAIPSSDDRTEIQLSEVKSLLLAYSGMT